MAAGAKQRRWTDNFHSIQGIVLPLICAAFAEIFLNDFVRRAPIDYFARVGRISLVFLSLYTIHRFAVSSLVSYKENLKDSLWLTVTLVGSILIVWIGKVFAIGITNYPGMIAVVGHLDPNNLHFAIPYATGALILQAVLGLHYGLVFALTLSLIVSLYSPGEPLLIVYVLCTTLVACLSLSRFRSRSAYIKAGFNVSIVAFPIALASVLVDGGLDTAEVFLRLGGAVLSGILCTFVAAGLLPVVELFGGYVTDMRLIEMATLDHPLLKDLSIQAPGTWNHSMVMGMMVEAAAEAIGANPVLARVGAYFHDIGKIKKPLYFVENQAGHENRHEKLSPSMSALIIRSHVKEGVELGEKFRLPRAILEMIPQHHGTNLIEYFYDKARKEAKAAAQDDAVTIDASLYRYPGPKPQTREAGLLMLADGIEAASRTISEPTLDRIQGLVQKMINKIFASGELDESDLTLRDLHLVAKSFTRVLAGIYHQRIAYAESAEKGAERSSEQGDGEAAAKDVAGAGASKKGKKEAEERGNKEDSKEDLKRLGLQ